MISISYRAVLRFNFVQVFGKLTQICETFKELNECGHANYQKWVYEQNFKNPEQAFLDVNKLHKKMLQQVATLCVIFRKAGGGQLPILNKKTKKQHQALNMKND